MKFSYDNFLKTITKYLTFYITFCNYTLVIICSFFVLLSLFVSLQVANTTV